MSENPKLFEFFEMRHHEEQGKDYPEMLFSCEITLRDLFAAAALAGMAQNAAWDYSSGPCNAAASERCYVIADAMLAERSKP